MIEAAMKSLRKGEFVLIHDAGDRENETDLVIAAEFVEAEDVMRMRTDGGGLVCVAIDGSIAKMIGLRFISEIYEYSSERFPILKDLEAHDIPYDEKSSFSLMVNHRKTFTGITDEDRALTISELGKLGKNPSQEEFGKNFRTPGHVPLLISSGLDKREGHTELSTALLKAAGLTPVTAICEMMGDNHKARSSENARDYAKKNNLVFLETDEIKNALK